MEKKEINKTSDQTKERKSSAVGRREVIKTLATVPLLGAMAYGLVKTRKTALIDRDISDVFPLSNKNAVFLQPLAKGKQIRLGLIGFGWKMACAQSTWTPASGSTPWHLSATNHPR